MRAIIVFTFCYYSGYKGRYHNLKRLLRFLKCNKFVALLLGLLIYLSFSTVFRVIKVEENRRIGALQS